MINATETDPNKQSDRCSDKRTKTKTKNKKQKINGRPNRVDWVAESVAIRSRSDAGAGHVMAADGVGLAGRRRIIGRRRRRRTRTPSGSDQRGSFRWLRNPTRLELQKKRETERERERERESGVCALSDLRWSTDDDAEASTA